MCMYTFVSMKQMNCETNSDYQIQTTVYIAIYVVIDNDCDMYFDMNTANFMGEKIYEHR